MFKRVFYVLLLSSSVSFAQSGNVKREIQRLSAEIYRATPGSTASPLNLERARTGLARALQLITSDSPPPPERGETYCRRFGNTSDFAPARISDGEWLQDYGTPLDQCRRQVASAGYALVCSRIRLTDFFAPKHVPTKAWRQEFGTDEFTCERQTKGAARNMYCRRIQATDYYAAARTSDGAWLQQYGSSLDACLDALPGVQDSPLVQIEEPKV